MFAAARQWAGADEIEVVVPDPPTVAALSLAIARQYPALAGLLRHAVFAVNAEYVSAEALLSAQDEVACIPPVSGG